MTHKIVTFIILTTVLASSFNTSYAKDDLSSIYQQALQSDPLLREAEATRLANNEARALALSNLLPQVSAGAGYNKSDSQGVSVSQIFPQGSPNDDASTTNSWSLQLQQSIFDWGSWVGLKRADKTILKSGLDFEVSRQDLIIRVANRYFAVLAAEDVLTFERASKEAIARQLDQTNTRFEVGMVAITDVHEAQAAFDQAIASEIDAKRRLALAKENLREITGRKVTELASPLVDLELGPPNPESEEVWVNKSLDQNLTLLSARMSAEIARSDIESQKTGHYPTVSLNLTRNGSDADRDDFIRDISSSGANNSTSLGVQLNVPIYSGGRTSSQVRQSVYQHRAAIERVERITRETERETRDAYLNVLANVSRIRALKQAVRSSQTALQATETGFEVGTRTTVDVLNSRRTLLDSERNYSQSRYDYLSNLLVLKRASGILDQTDIDEMNQLLN